MTKKRKRTDGKLESEYIEQVDRFMYIGNYAGEDMRFTEEIETKILKQRKQCIVVKDYVNSLGDS